MHHMCALFLPRRRRARQCFESGDFLSWPPCPAHKRFPVLCWNHDVAPVENLKLGRGRITSLHGAGPILTGGYGMADRDGTVGEAATPSRNNSSSRRNIGLLASSYLSCRALIFSLRGRTRDAFFL